MKLKIAISNVSIKDFPAASFLRSFYIAKELAKKGHKVTFLTTQKNSRVFPYTIEERDLVKIIAFPAFLSSRYIKYGYSFLPTILKLLHLFFNNYDIIHTDHHRISSFLPAYFSRLFKKSVLINEWWDFLGKGGQYETKSKYWKYTIGPVDNFLEKWTKVNSDGIVVLSEFLRKKAIGYGVNTDQILKLWGASDTSSIRFYKSNKINRIRFNLPVDAYILFYSNLGQEEFIENIALFKAIRQLRSSGENIILLRTGKPFSKEFKTKFNLGDEICEIGYVDYLHYPELLSCADAFVLLQSPKLRNLGRWPNISGDYLAAGRPILSNSIGDIKYLEDSFGKAFVKIINFQDENEIGVKILKMIKSNLSNEFLFEEIRDYAENSFSWSKRIVELESFYIKLKSEI